MSLHVRQAGDCQPTEGHFGQIATLSATQRRAKAQLVAQIACMLSMVLKVGPAGLASIQNNSGLTQGRAGLAVAV